VQGEFGQGLRVVGFQQIEAAGEIGAGPAAQQLDPLG
jgi:hypothetical protein